MNKTVETLVKLLGYVIGVTFITGMFIDFLGLQGQKGLIIGFSVIIILLLAISIHEK